MRWWDFKEKGMKGVLFFSAIFATITVIFIISFLFIEGAPAFAEIGPGTLVLGPEWVPTGVPQRYGGLPLVMGTLLVTAGAVLFCAPLGVACALFLSQVAPPRARTILKPAVELLAAIPSVVYGFFGLSIMARWIKVTFDIPTGETWLNGSILLGIMALPTVVSVSEEAITAVPREFKEASLALGANKWQTIRRVILPSALSGITAAIVLGLGRAIGETMAVMMATGNAPIIPEPIWNIFSPIRTITGTLGTEMGEVPLGSIHYHALFALAVILFVVVLIITFAATWTLGYIRQKQFGTGGRKGRFSISLSPGLQRSIRKAISYALAFGLIIFVYAALGPIAAAGAIVLYLAYRWLAPRMGARRSQSLAIKLLWVSGIVTMVILGILVAFIAIRGAPAISWDFLTKAPRDSGRAGGIFPAIIGTIYLVLGAVVFALPVGIGAAIYLNEYAREGRVTRMIRMGVDALNGTPSVVFGLFGMAFFVLYLHFGRSLLAGQLTLGLMILPTIVRTTEESLKFVPMSLREGSLALGATKWQTVRRVVIPPALPGIITGGILAVGRAAGETAPIIFTAAVFITRFLPDSLLDPVMALPYHLFSLAVGVPNSETNAYGTALVLLVLVLLVNLGAIALRNRYYRERL
jgi:phosphate transport system permease protein